MSGQSGLTRFFSSNHGFVAGFLAVDDVLAGLGGHKDFDAALRTLEAFGSGFPEQLAVCGDTKDVKRRHHE